MRERADLLQGSLDLLILKTLALQPLHGWGISKRIRQLSADVLQVNQGSLYPALHRLEEKGWLVARAQANAYYYRAGVDREQALGGMLSGLVDMAFAGSTSNLVMALLQNQRISTEEAQRLRDMIDASEKETP